MTGLNLLLLTQKYRRSCFAPTKFLWYIQENNPVFIDSDRDNANQYLLCVLCVSVVNYSPQNNYGLSTN
jgi:hypothetical protein